MTSTRALSLALGLCCLLVATAARAEEGPDAFTLANDLLTQGARTFDERDAGKMAASFAEDGEINMVLRDSGSGAYKTNVTTGRAAVETFYREMFAKREAGAKSRNAVGHARFLGANFLLIEGAFNHDTSKGEPLPFVQVREKVGAHWLIKSVQLFVVGS